MKILIVAPDSDLNTQVDLIAAMGGNMATPLHGVVPVREVLNEIASGNYDAVHFASHGDRNALLMSDGTIDEDQLENSIKRSSDNGRQIKLVFLNACQSITTAIYIHSPKEGSPSFVIGWRTDVQDAVATSFAVRFYETLRLNDEDVHDAFDSGVAAIRRSYPEVESPLLLNGRLQDIRIAMNDLVIRFGAMEKELVKERDEHRVVPLWLLAAFAFLSPVPAIIILYFLWVVFR